jgi:hypothetical protein
MSDLDADLLAYPRHHRRPFLRRDDDRDQIAMTAIAVGERRLVNGSEPIDATHRKDRDLNRNLHQSCRDRNGDAAERTISSDADRR